MSGSTGGASVSAPVLRVLLLGGSALDAEHVRATLASSTAISFEVTHAPGDSPVLELPDSEESDVVLLDVHHSDLLP